MTYYSVSIFAFEQVCSVSIVDFEKVYACWLQGLIGHLKPSNYQVRDLSGICVIIFRFERV